MYGVLLSTHQTLFLSLASQHVMTFINQTWTERYNTEISEQLLTFLWSIIVSIFTIGGLVGSLVGGTLAIKYGRLVLHSNVTFHNHLDENIQSGGQMGKQVKDIGAVIQ